MFNQDNSKVQKCFFYWGKNRRWSKYFVFIVNSQTAHLPLLNEKENADVFLLYLTTLPST